MVRKIEHSDLFIDNSTVCLEIKKNGRHLCICFSSDDNLPTAEILRAGAKEGILQVFQFRTERIDETKIRHVERAFANSRMKSARVKPIIVMAGTCQYVEWYGLGHWKINEDKRNWLSHFARVQSHGEDILTQHADAIRDMVTKDLREMWDKKNRGYRWYLITVNYFNDRCFKVSFNGSSGA